MTLKSDLINGAYSQLRISGLTVNPTPEDNELALSRLENMAEEFFGRSIDINYFFEGTPSSASPHNVERKYWDAIEANLAVKLCPDFGKTPNIILLAKQQAGFSFLSSATAIIREIPYPERQPKGRGNTFKHFYGSATQTPLEPESITMAIDDVDDFVESFSAYLVDGETIASYTIEADTGLTIVSSSNATPDINYRINAVGNDADSSNSFLQVRIVVTTSDSRIKTRLINFGLVDTEL